MANGHGGSRTPSNPAPVSAPGALSRRTDGGPQQVNAQMTGMAYGENADFMDIQSGAPMAATPGAADRPARQAPAANMPLPTPLFAPTQRPDEPVTAGAPFGPGSNVPASIPQGLPKPVRSFSDTVNSLYSATGDPRLARLLNVAEKYGW